MSIERSETFQVYIPPTDDDDDSLTQTSSLEPTHNQPTAPRYMHRLLRDYHATPENEEPKLKAPDSFHSLTHWFSLYVYAVTGHDEVYVQPHAVPAAEESNLKQAQTTATHQAEPDLKLQNICMDAIRKYYRDTGSTASAFRIENLHKALPNGEGGALMRKFLLETAAWRIMIQGRSSGLKDDLPVWKKMEMDRKLAQEEGLSESFRKMLRKDAELAVEFASTVVRVISGSTDPRGSKNELWHVGIEGDGDSGVEMEDAKRKDSGIGPDDVEGLVNSINAL